MADILAISAHPDDIELNAAGTLMKALDAGRSVGLCDLTEGERGSRGSRELRREETSRANRVMGIPDENRWNLGIPDGDVAVTEENVLKVVRAIRYFRPRVLLCSWNDDRHPDHPNGNTLVRRACFDAGLTMLHTQHDGEEQEPHRPEKIYCFFHTYERMPDFVVDISDYMERKLAALAAYSTQFTVPGHDPLEDETAPQTFISGSDFMEAMIARMRHWGFMVGVRYAEAYATVSGPLKVDDLLHTT